MAKEIFLARTEEQDKFKQVLQSHSTGLWKQVRTTLNTPLFENKAAKPTDRNLPFLLLFHGEGGMGKTRLMRRLEEITREKPFCDRFHSLFLDWEGVKNRYLDLQVGHDNIRPETVLSVLYEAFVDRDWGNHFREYRDRVKELQAAEAKVDKQLKSKPEGDLNRKVSQLGAKGVAWLIRSQTGTDIVSQEVLETTIEASAEVLHQARQFVSSALTEKEYQIYAHPHETLAEALGEGIAALAKRKPLVVFLDTYEIVDRPECDYTLRQAIRHSGKQVVWAIAGRANLADSGRRGKTYFRGYRQDFADDRLYAKPMSEFGLAEIRLYFQEYFQGEISESTPTDAEFNNIAEFSLGIPFVISQVAAMWREGKPMAEITAPVETALGESARDRVIKATCERFLVHCFGATEQERDLLAIYALAIIRRPDAELLREMLDVADLEAALQGLRQRYSFIWVEGMRLDEKLAGFLREYLQSPVRRFDDKIQELSDRALAWLELQLEQLTRDITDTAEQLAEERIAETIADFVHHRFWLGEEEGWRALVPRFVEAWQYDIAFAKSLLEVAEGFSPTFAKDGKRRLKLFREGLAGENEAVGKLLAELEKLDRRKWLAGEGEAERRAILQLKSGELLYRQERYREALEVCLEVKRCLPEGLSQLRKDLAEGFYLVSTRFIWPQDSYDAVYSAEGERAIRQAVALNGKKARYYNPLGVVCEKSDQLDEAVSAYEKAIKLDPNYAIPHQNLGILYSNAGETQKALAAYEKAIKLDSNFAIPHYNLGILYSDIGENDKAIAAYNKAIELDPKDATPHYNLGNLYSNIGESEKAIAAYNKAIKLDPKDDSAYNRLGWLYLLQEDWTQARSQFETAIRLDSNNHYPVFNLGLVFALQGNLKTAHQQWHKGLVLCQDEDDWDRANRSLYTLVLGESDRGIAELQALIESGASIGVLKNALEDAEVIARCPTPPAGIDTVVELLKEAIGRGGGWGDGVTR